MLSGGGKVSTCRLYLEAGLHVPATDNIPWQNQKTVTGIPASTWTQDVPTTKQNSTHSTVTFKINSSS